MSVKFKTGTVRLSFANVLKARSFNGGEEKYSCSFIIPKSDTDTIERFKKAIAEAIAEGKAKLDPKNLNPVPAALKLPLRDGDVERPAEEAYKDSMFFNANNKKAPLVLDAQRRPIISEDDIYSGCYGIAVVELYAFNSNGNKGIACSLQGVQKVRDGEPLGGGGATIDDFDVLEDGNVSTGLDDFLA